MPKKLYDTKYNCCGCSACYSVCPVNAISMKEDEEGFKYPHIDQNTCISCNQCESVCPLKKENSKLNPIHIYASKNKNEDVRRKSSSGGMFSLIANYVESENGVIYGAAFDDKYNVLHMRAENTEEWKKFCVSKYVQSDLNDTFRDINRDLKSGRKVLFSGTPCQVDGLKRYLEKTKTDADNLLTCDIVCHGTPSPKVWGDYLDYLSDQLDCKIGYVSFRDKAPLGWHKSTLTVKNKHNQTIISETQKDNYFFQLFMCHYILRPSCYKCKYANFHRSGDFTLGDFWGIEKSFPKFDDDKGISLAMVNTKKGTDIWSIIQDDTEFFEVTQEQAVQPNLVEPSKENPDRECFWHWYNKYGLKRIGQRMGYIPVNMAEKMLIFLYRCIEKVRRL